MDMNTFLTTLYVLIDDWYQGEQQAQMQRHGGPAVQMSDSEVLTVAIAGQWRVGVPWRSERGVVRYMQTQGRGWFPQMLKRSEFNERVRQLWGAVVQLQQQVADWLEAKSTLYEVVDCVPLPACSLAQAASGRGHWLWWSRLGYGGNQGGWYWGEQVLTSVTAQGVVTGWVLGSAPVDDRWLLQALVSQRRGHLELLTPAGDKKHTAPPAASSFGGLVAVGKQRARPYLADQGFNGKRWRQQWWQRYGVDVITVPPANAREAWSAQDCRWLASKRQIVETLFARLGSVFALNHLQAHSRWGQLTRLALVMAAYNLGLFLNRLAGRPDGALETLLC